MLAMACTIPWTVCELACEQAGGRLALVELPALLGVDLAHCERQAAALVSESGGEVIEAQGELMSAQVCSIRVHCWPLQRVAPSASARYLPCAHAVLPQRGFRD